MSDWALPRSPRDEVAGLVYFPRMVDKIRLHAEGRLHGDYVEKLGGGFDEMCCLFLGVDYEGLKAQVLGGAGVDEIFAWALESGAGRSVDDRGVWSAFLAKRGWRDEVSDVLEQRKIDLGLEHRDDVQTFFDFIDADEGRR